MEEGRAFPSPPFQLNTSLEDFGPVTLSLLSPLPRMLLWSKIWGQNSVCCFMLLNDRWGVNQTNKLSKMATGLSQILQVKNYLQTFLQFKLNATIVRGSKQCWGACSLLDHVYIFLNGQRNYRLSCTYIKARSTVQFTSSERFLDILTPR